MKVNASATTWIQTLDLRIGNPALYYGAHVGFDPAAGRIRPILELRNRQYIGGNQASLLTM